MCAERVALFSCAAQTAGTPEVLALAVVGACAQHAARLPGEVCDAAIQAWHDGSAPINSVEGCAR